ncbi:hypothetical protein HCN51_39495 [Nonomuraea sp. FMUSA5-5]|uniref:Uncharacterized protein n=1 Tax=Nonomuraea composti TaxID=2720023 RepID=A0ABX1BGI8_9ACTN|nr:hypothetical protein [Nonomuraea sp. FMUSA5-5]NJP95457.1 hypothetical protein [Nonomuraea sp. FMUSA5-5]
MIEQAIVDAYDDDDEQLSGLHVVIGDNLAVPFETTVLGLPLPGSPPGGAEWIHTFRRWAKVRA